MCSEMVMPDSLFWSLNKSLGDIEHLLCPMQQQMGSPMAACRELTAVLAAIPGC